MIGVRGGGFVMGAAGDRGEADEHPAHAVQVPSFCLDRVEVSVSAYTSCPSCGPAGAGASCNASLVGRALHPINCVSWGDAARYCAWRGARLPSEVEWEFAARGPEGRTHPWGEGLPWERTCWERDESQGTCPAAAVLGDANPQGIRDLAGNVSEWVAEWYAPYGAGSGDGLDRVVRGASWETRDPSAMRATRRDRLSPTRRRSTVGFRCAAAPIQ